MRLEGGVGAKCLGQSWRRPATRGCNKGEKGVGDAGEGRGGGPAAYPDARGSPPSPVPK